MEIKWQSRAGRWCKTSASCACHWDMLEQRKQSFLTLAEENQSLVLYRNPLIIFFTNPRFVLLICDRHLFCSLSAFVTNHATPTSYVICQNNFHFWHLDEVREKYYVWNMDTYLTKTHGFATGGLYLLPGAYWLSIIPHMFLVLLINPAHI